MNSLRTWNFAAAMLHAGFALWSIFKLPDKSVSMYKLGYNVSSEPASDLDYTMTIEPDGTRNIKLFVVAFFAVTALAHTLYASNAFGYANAILGYGWNPYRWIEYSFTAAFMIYVIAIVAGAKESSNALVAALLIPGLMLQGLTVERELHQNQLASWASYKSSTKPTVDAVLVWANFLPAWIFFGIKWYIIWNAYFQLKQQLQNEDKELDPRITQLVTIQFIGFTLFGLLQTVQVYSWINPSRGNWSQQAYIQYEKGYIALSFIVKAFLGISVARLLNET